VADKATAPVSEIGYANAYGNISTSSTSWWNPDPAETNRDLLWPRNIEIYDQMRRQDSQVAAVLRAVTLPIRRTEWRIDGAGAKAKVTKMLSEDLSLPILGSDKLPTPIRTRDRFSWPEHLQLALLEIVFGHMFFEQVYRVDENGFARLRKLGPRMPRTITKINVGIDGGLESIMQAPPAGVPSGLPVLIPVSRLVAYVHEREGGNWLGSSLLRPAYKHWLIKDRLIRTHAQTIDRNGMGVPIYTGQDGASPEDLTKGAALAQALRSGDNAGASVPYGASLIMQGVDGALPDAMPAIDYHDSQIARAVLAHFLNLGTQTGSWALGTTFADFFVLSLQTLAQQIADVATQHVVEDWVDINFGSDEPAPRIVFDEIGSRHDATADAIRSLLSSGALSADRRLEQFLRNMYGLPMADPAHPMPVPTPAQQQAPVADPSTPMGEDSVAS